MKLKTLTLGPPPKIAVDVAGDGPLVILLHGIGGNRLNWREQLQSLAPEFTAVAWDARGYGASEDYEGALDFADFSADLQRVIDAFGCRRAHLVGLSMGGRIALDFYGRTSDHVASLVLADTSAGAEATRSREALEEVLRLRQKPLLDGQTPVEMGYGMAQHLVAPDASAAAVQSVIDSFAALRKASYLKTLDTVTRYTKFPPFASIKVPTLVMVGEHDRIATPDYARSMAAAIPNGQFCLLPDAGHLSNLENPDAFDRALITFLRRHASAADTPSRGAGEIESDRSARA